MPKTFKEEHSIYIVGFPIFSDDGRGLYLSWKSGVGYSAYYGMDYALLFSTERAS